MPSPDEVLPIAYNNRLDWPMGGDGFAAATTVTMRTMEGDPAVPASTWTASRCLWTDCFYRSDPLPTTPGEATEIWGPDACQLWRIELTDADGGSRQRAHLRDGSRNRGEESVFVALGVDRTGGGML